MSLKKVFLPLISTALAANALAQDALTTIPSLNVQHYMGTWYEVAKLPNPFQKNCVSNTTAKYEVQANGTILVTNRCNEADGKVKEAHR